MWGDEFPLITDRRQALQEILRTLRSFLLLFFQYALIEILRNMNRLSSSRFITRCYATQEVRRLQSLCIANRGEIVHRVNDTATRMGIKTSTVYTEPDKDLPSATCGSVNLSLGQDQAGYIDIEKIVMTAKAAGCDSIHPGYGFLSENAQFAKRVREEGLIFVGPPQVAIEAMGSKDRSKEIMEAANVPCVPGYHGSNQDAAFLKAEAEKIGFPVLIKAVLGGGGKGMRIVKDINEFDDQLKSAKSEAKSSFGNDEVLVEKYIITPRHIEVQVFADKYGNVVALGERDCSVQRRHQKVLEESPAPGLDQSTREGLWSKARDAARAVGYEGAGTVEFILDKDTNQFYFMEMNTRLQVEHPVTEAVTNIDLVEWQLLVAAGFPLPKTQEEIELKGHAFEARIYCEDPFKQFLPSSGQIVHLQKPSTNSPRLDFTFNQLDTVSSLYDPMIGKLIVYGKDRDDALSKMKLALKELEIVGPTTNVEFIKRIIVNPDFSGQDPQGLETGFIPKHEAELFNQNVSIPNEVYVQAAIGELLAGLANTKTNISKAFTDLANASWSEFTKRTEFQNPDDSIVKIGIQQTGKSSFRVLLDKQQQKQEETVDVLAAEYISTNLSDLATGFSGKLHIRFPHGQFVNSIVVQPSHVHVFHDGIHYTLKRPQPSWLTKALGIKESKHSVVAPMPCKVSRVGVKVGDQVSKGQELVVILSMKMETSIRSPGDRKIKRIVHQEGDIVSQGTVLVEFEEVNE